MSCEKQGKLENDFVKAAQSRDDLFERITKTLISQVCRDDLRHRLNNCKKLLDTRNKASKAELLTKVDLYYILYLIFNFFGSIMLVFNRHLVLSRCFRLLF